MARNVFQEKRAFRGSATGIHSEDADVKHSPLMQSDERQFAK
jgi:hypothetical protein